MRNRFLKSDVKLWRDTQGEYTAEHTFCGTLFEGAYFLTRSEARHEAGVILGRLKEEEAEREAAEGLRDPIFNGTRSVLEKRDDLFAEKTQP